MSYTSIFGGNKTRLVKVNKETCDSYKCLHCDKISYLPKWIESRATRISCTQCGGPTEETDASFKRNNRITKEVANKRAVSKLGSLPYRCKICKEKFRSEVGLRLHIRDSHEHD